MVLHRVVEALHPIAAIVRIEHLSGPTDSMQVRLHLQKPTPNLNLAEALRRHGFEVHSTLDRSVIRANHGNCRLVIQHNNLASSEVLVVLQPEKFDGRFIQEELSAASQKLAELKNLS